METLYTAVATSTGGRAGHVASSDKLIDFEVRPPAEMGGPKGGYTNPEQLFAAGYAACFGSAISHVALNDYKKRVDPEVTVKVSIGRIPTGFALSAEIEAKIKGVDFKTAGEIVKAAHQLCPYSVATRGNMEVKVKALPAE